MKIIISATNDLISDYRVHRTALTLQQKCNYNVTVAGRKRKTSLPLATMPYKIIRFKLPFEKGPLFYILYNITLFIYLLFQKADLLWANDLDTLPANYFASKLKRKKLIVDCHELFTEVPELIERKTVKAIWTWVERKMLPAADLSFTVSQSIADYYNDCYNMNMRVLRNVPHFLAENKMIDLPPLPSNITEKKIIVYQGVVNIGRGLEKVIKAMIYVENAVFLIIGDGDIMNTIKNLIVTAGVKEKVHLTGRLPFSQLPLYVRLAHIGISLEEDMGKNYYYALPNKLFAYIQAGVPVLTSDFPEMAKIVNNYQIGLTTSENNPKKLALLISDMLNDEKRRSFWKANLKTAARELCWENEEKILIESLKKINQ